MRALGSDKSASECLLLGLFLEKLASYDSEKVWAEALKWVEQASSMTESEEVPKQHIVHCRLFLVLL